MSIENFREDTRAWLDANCPASMRDRPVHFEDAFDIYNTDDAKSWLNACAAKGWTAPLWPKVYGGAEMSGEE